MEITLENINSAFNTEADTSAEIEQIFENWSDYSVEDILNNKINTRGSEKIWQNINSIKHRLTNESTSKEQPLLELAEIVNFLKDQIRGSFIDTDIKALLKFLSVNCYLHIPLKRFIDSLGISSEQINQLLSKAEQISNAFYCKIEMPTDAPYFEKEFLRNYKEGITENNVQKVYTLINAVENGNSLIGFFFLERILAFIYELDINLFCKCIEVKKEPYELVIALQWMGKDDILHLNGKIFSKNKWLLFELIRQVVESRNPSTESEAEIISDFLGQIYNISQDFYNQTIVYFNRFENVNKAVGLHLATLTEPEIEEVIVASFTIDRYDHFIEIKTALLDSFSAMADDSKTIYFLSVVYRKWEIFLKEVREDSEFYAFDLVTTNYANYILRYILSIYKRNEIIERTDSLILKILNLDSQWFNDTSQRTTEFYLLLTELDLYSHAVKYSDTTIDKTINMANWQMIYNSSIVRSRYMHRGSGNESLLDNINNNLKGLDV